MSTPIDVNGGPNVRRAGPHRRGGAAQPGLREADGGSTPGCAKRLERLRARLREAEENGKRLEAEKAAIAAERDGYLKSLHYFTRKDFTFTAEEIADLDKNGVEFTKEFIDELERDLRERGNRP